MHCSPGAGGHHVAVGAERVRREACDQHVSRCPFLERVPMAARRGLASLVVPKPSWAFGHGWLTSLGTGGGYARTLLRGRTEQHTVLRGGSTRGFQEGPPAQARARRAERRIARQASAQRRKRQIQAGIGASLALVLIVLGTIWLLGGFDPEPPARPSPLATAPGTCKTRRPTRASSTPATRRRRWNAAPAPRR